jgi:hypothetical protein
MYVCMWVMARITFQARSMYLLSGIHIIRDTPHIQQLIYDTRYRLRFQTICIINILGNNLQYLCRVICTNYYDHNILLLGTISVTKWIRVTARIFTIRIPPRSFDPRFFIFVFTLELNRRFSPFSHQVLMVFLY